MDDESVADAVDEVGRMLRADGADLLLVEANPKTARVHLRLVLDTVGCEECMLPPDMLRETINDSLQRRIVGEFELVLDDPRRSREPGVTARQDEPRGVERARRGVPIGAARRRARARRRSGHRLRVCSRRSRTSPGPNRRAGCG